MRFISSVTFASLSVAAVLGAENHATLQKRLNCKDAMKDVDYSCFEPLRFFTGCLDRGNSPFNCYLGYIGHTGQLIGCGVDVMDCLTRVGLGQTA